MEYYILKLYENEKQKCSEVEQGFDRFEPKVKRIVIVCIIVMFASCTEMIVTVLLFPKQVWYLIGVLFSVITMTILFGIDNMHQKKHMDKYVDSHKKKIGVLEKVLEKEFDIKDKNKIEELIKIYQDYVDKEKEREKKRNSMIIAIFSAVAGILTISFENMGAMGIDFSGWIYLAAFFLFFAGIAVIWIYSYTFFETLSKKYEIMIKDLKELLLIKY